LYIIVEDLRTLPSDGFPHLKETEARDIRTLSLLSFSLISRKTIEEIGGKEYKLGELLLIGVYDR
jgi:hypothetical protein